MANQRLTRHGLTVGVALGLLALAAACLVAVRATGAETPRWQRPGPGAVTTTTAEWRDEGRRREVPVRLYQPSGDGPFPVVVFSHGLGGTRDGYSYLASRWASQGYVCVHLQHVGSDDSVWRGADDKVKAMKRAMADPRNAINRPLDVTFAIDTLTRLNGEAGPLKGKLDLARIGLAGHSFGAYTTLASVGQSFAGARQAAGRFKDERIKAAIAMSAPVPGRQTDLDAVFGGITTPCFHMTGTRDEVAALNDTKPEQRRLPYDHSHGERYLMILDGGDHMIFAGRAGPGLDQAREAAFLEAILAGSSAFWDACLRDDAEARRWLAKGSFAALLGRFGTFEQRAD